MGIKIGKKPTVVMEVAPDLEQKEQDESWSSSSL